MASAFVGALALLLSGAASTAAAECPPPHLCALQGEWAADGVSFGRPSRVSMTWETMLGGKFARVDYIITLKGEAGAAFSGVGVYRPLEPGHFDGTWFDSQGAMHPLRAEFNGEALRTLWGAPGGTYGRTTYSLRGPDAVEIIDEIERDGVFKEFSRNVLQRAD